MIRQIEKEMTNTKHFSFRISLVLSLIGLGIGYGIIQVLGFMVTLLGVA